jgi:hypothetical protein
MRVSQIELAKLPPGVQALLDRVPPEYMHDLALDLAWAAPETGAWSVLCREPIRFEQP